MKRVCGTALGAILLAALGSSAGADEPARGTMHLMPSKEWTRKVPDEKLGKLRGGFVGVQWSLEFVATVINGQGDVSSNIPGASGSLPEGSTATVNDGNLQISTLVALGTGGAFNGVGIVNVIPGNFNVVDFKFNLNVSIINVLNGASLPATAGFLSGR